VEKKSGKKQNLQKAQSSVHIYHAGRAGGFEKGDALVIRPAGSARGVGFLRL